MENRRLKNRNYQLDFFKLIFSIFVFVAHTIYITPNTISDSPLFPTLGLVSVFYFFIVSGMMMLNTTTEKSDGEYGEQANRFVLHKIKNILLPYWIALGISIITYAISYGDVKQVLLQSIPEILLLEESGVYFFMTNGPTWYISALFIAMLPLAYIMIKNRDFYVHVFAPITAIILFGYMFNTQPYGAHTFNGIVLYTIIRAVMGLCIGAISWKLTYWFSENIKSKVQRYIVTFAEIVLYFIFFDTVFHYSVNSKIIYSVMMLLPIAIAISFSKVSYISYLFQFKWMRFFAPISLAIYLNHNTGKRLALGCFPKKSFEYKVIAMAGFTVAVSIIYFIIIKLIKLAWNKKLKKIILEK